MAKKVLLKMLEEHLGQFIDGLQNTRLAVWSGDIELSNLEFKVDAFDKLQLPFRVKNGFIKTFHIHVPWTRLGRYWTHVNSSSL
jgi:vacuolar protein sorting-associated protein 13A/C